MLSGLIEVVRNKYPELLDIYNNIERLEQETGALANKGIIIVKPKLEARWNLIDRLIEKAESEGFTILQSVYPKSSDSELGWIVSWPIKFFIPTNTKGMTSEISDMKINIEDIGGLFVPHNAEGYYENNKNAGTINILIPPESISAKMVVEGSTEIDSYKITIIKLLSQKSVVCFKSTDKRIEIAITYRDLIPTIDFY